MPFPSTNQPLTPPLLEILGKRAVRQIRYFLSSMCAVDVQVKGFAGLNHCFLKLPKSHLVGSRVREHLAWCLTGDKDSTRTNQ